MDSCWLSASLQFGRPLSAGLGVVFTEILLTPQGMSKGCGYVFPPSVQLLAPASRLTSLLFAVSLSLLLETTPSEPSRNSRTKLFLADLSSSERCVPLHPLAVLLSTK